MLGHADETDDSHAPSLCHPGCAIVPAALAMAEREGRNGTAFLRAVALGYDVGTRLNMALHAYDFRDAGHSSHSFGPTFGAAAAAGALANLNADETRWLLSYAAQQCSGISCWMRDEEHIEKAFDFGGMPARNGVAAATMVATGFTGVDDAFTGERNFFIAYDETKRIGPTSSAGRWGPPSRRRSIRCSNSSALTGSARATSRSSRCAWRSRAPTPPTTGRCPISACSTCAR
jgi:2-methylcitrate dehydratase PrpD